MVVWDVAPNGPAAESGVKVGDRVLSVDGKRIFGRGSGAKQSRLDGPEGTAALLEIRRPGLDEPLAVSLVRRRVEGVTLDFHVHEACEASDGRLWFGLRSGQILEFDPREPDPERAWTRFDENDGLELDVQPRIAHTRGGGIWAVSNNRGSGVNRFDGKRWTHTRLSEMDGRDINTSVLQTQDGVVWVGGSGALHAFSDGQWTIYKASDVRSIPSHRVRLMEASDGALWVAGLGQAAARLEYGRSRWLTYEGLWFQCETDDGVQWFVSDSQRVVSRTGSTWQSFGPEDGLMDMPARLLVSVEGDVWAAGSHGGAAATSRLTRTARDAGALEHGLWRTVKHPALAHMIGFNAVLLSQDGSLWFGADADAPEGGGHQGGALQHREGRWTHHRPPEAPKLVYTIGQSEDGTLWFGGEQLRSYDGAKWSPVADEEGLSSWIHDIGGGGSAELWVATRTYGVYRLNGRGWTRFDSHDGLPGDRVDAIMPARDNTVWAVSEEGVSRFDGSQWISGVLPTEVASGIKYGGLKQSQDGAIWLNHWQVGQHGFRIWTTRYTPGIDPPDTRMVTAVDRVSHPGNISLAWEGRDSWEVTPKTGLLYSIRQNGGPWSAYGPATNRFMPSLASGRHTLEVRALDLDLNADPSPAVLRLTVIPPVYRQPWFLVLITAFTGAIVLQTVRVFRRDQKLKETQAQLIQELQGELQTAHNMQMALMPSENPAVQGYDIAGRCVPAAEVGGDFYQYFQLPGGRLALAMADVTGHSMEAAIPMVMFSGILKSHMELGGTLQERFDRLNSSLCGTVTGHTFVCFVMGELLLEERVLAVSDSGCPFPYHYRAATRETVEVPIDAYPLGVRPDTKYLVAELQLEPGDYVVFCSDGIMEAVDESLGQFGYERAEEEIRNGCREGLSADRMIDRLLGAVAEFRGEVAQADDVTCVVLRVV